MKRYHYNNEIDEMSTKISEIDMSELASLFNGLKPDDTRGPVGHIPIGDHCEISPEAVQTKSQFQLLRNSFGYCVRGPRTPPFEDVDKVGLIRVRNNNNI